MIVIRILAQLLIAAALMVLGSDALNAVETGVVDPLSFSSLVGLLSERAGLTWGLDLEASLRAAENLPAFAQTSLLYVVTSPAFLVFAVVGVVMAWAFRTRG